MCARLFKPTQRKLLLGEWARDTLGLTPQQYEERVQVYKRLDRIWDDERLQYRHPDFDQGGRWGQHNTLLIDDSLLKASTQPFNHVEVPEYVEGDERDGDGRNVLAQVVGYLEEARRWNDVSAFVREKGFVVDAGWRWEWKGKKKKDVGKAGEENSVRGEDDAGKNKREKSVEDEEDGGVRL